MTARASKDFFVSYNVADRDWAEWIAWTLEEAGFEVVIQAWDFKGNFVQQMDEAAKKARKIAIVLSQSYVDAAFTHPEWQAFFRRDPKGDQDLIVQFRVREVKLEGLLAPIIYTDLEGLSESAAAERVEKRAKGERLKPEQKPPFPGGVPHADRTVRDKPPFPALDLDRYRAWARARWDLVDLTALTRPGAEDPDRPRPKLSQLFVPQPARRSRPSQSLPRDWLRRQGLDPDREADRLAERLRHWEASRPEPVLDLVAAPDARALVLLGDPGAGKSSLARRLVLHLLDPPAEGAPPWRKALGARLPVLVELRDYVAREAEGRCQTFFEFLDYLDREQGMGLPRAALEAALAKEPSLVVFDGLDEVFEPVARKRIAQEIAGFAGDHRQARVLVTSRVAGFDPVPFETASHEATLDPVRSEPGFLVATLDDLAPDQVEAFAKVWFELDFAGRPAEAERARRDLLDTLRDRPNLQILAGNPLLLTMMAIVARHERLARSRVGLYDQMLGVLCYGWDLRKELGVEADSLLKDLGPEEKKRILRAVAWRMQAAEEGLRANAITEEELRQTLAAQLASEFAEPRPGRRAAAARRLILLLQERNWMLTLRGPGLYGFVHRTFLEHLCASELRRRWQEHEIGTEELIRNHVLPRAGDDSWREVVRLLAAQLPPKVVAQLLEALLPPPEKVLLQADRLALALECIAEQEPRRLPDLAEPCAAAMRAVYALYAECAERELEFDSRIEMRVLRALREVGAAWPNGPALLDELGWPRCYLDEFLPEDEIWAALAAGPYREHPLLRAILLDDLKRDDPAVRWRAIWALAARFPGDPDIAKVLGELAVRDPDARTRMAALQDLAEHFADTPEILRLLRARAAEDPDRMVRRHALELFVPRSPDRADTLRLYRERAVDDQDANLRRETLRAFVLCSPDRAETLRLLRERAVRDQDAGTRAQVIVTLAEHFADAPGTRRLLCGRAVKDPDKGTRGVALLELARISNLPRAEVLLSRSFDGNFPIDPMAPIGEERVREAAARLGLPEAEVRGLYERLAAELPITLAWRPRS